MPSGKLPNYLRLHRKRLGFSEKEIAFLLGLRCSSQVSRYEHFRRVPNLMTALAFHAIFRTASPELFGGKFETVEREIVKRAKRLLKKFEGQPGSAAMARKLLWLRILVGEVEAPPKS